MSDVTGTVHRAFGGQSYALRLTLGGIAQLQGKFGDDLGGMLRQAEGEAEGKIPNFGILLAIVRVALEKGGVASDLSEALADDMLTEDPKLAGEVLRAAFPNAGSASKGKAKAPKS